MAIRSICAIVLTTVLFVPTSRAQDGFDPFVFDDHSVPGTAELIDDPTGGAVEERVYSFSLPAGRCSDAPYEAGREESDCFFNSARSQVREDVFATRQNANAQPPESWYGWAVYFPEDFNYGTKQTKGSFEFAYWHNHQCPHLTFQNWAGDSDTLHLGTNRALGNFECAPGPSLPIAKFQDLVGKWSRFEVFVKWASDESGEAKVYLDGRFVLDYKGPTLTAGYEDINYFKFGLYLCCTPDYRGIKEASVLYTAIKRADKREDLFVDADRVAIEALQKALNALGCDVGAPDGIIGRRTREEALTCRAFPEGQLPHVLSASSLSTFLKLYSDPAAHNLPSGNPSDAAEVALVSYPPQGEGGASLVAAEFETDAVEVRPHKTGNDAEANSDFVVNVKRHEEIGEFDFAILGRFDYSHQTFSQLSFLLNGNVTPADTVKACGSAATIKFPDGSDHVSVNFVVRGTEFLANNAACLLEHLSGDELAIVRFLTSNFSDIAVGMVRSGGDDAIKHDGIRTFINRVALGELSVGR